MRIRFSDLSPDGVRMVVDWDKFLSGTSLFIPCVNTKEAYQQVLEVTKLGKHEVVSKVMVENGKYGVRIWRVV
jgi:hypothetical protein